MRPWLPERRFAWEAATKAQDPSMNNFLANSEHTLTEVEMIPREHRARAPRAVVIARQAAHRVPRPGYMSIDASTGR
jgi:hypothetical protein